MVSHLWAFVDERGWCLFFFFSSRRRHTRCGRDWSSDVCSSDLFSATDFYNSSLVTQVINKVMSRGKKSVAEKIVYDALERIAEKTGKPAVEVLEIGRASCRERG